MTYLPFQDLQPKKQSPHGGTRNLRGGEQNAALQPCGRFFGDTNFERCSLHHHADCILMQPLNYLKQLLNRDLTTQEPYPKRIAADAGKIVARSRRVSREKQNGSRNADDWIRKARSGSPSAIRIATADDWKVGFSSGAAQVRDLTALIDRYAGGLDSVPIHGRRKCDISFGLVERNDLVDLALKNIEQTAISVGS
jgi:hypothetical protein